MFSFEEYKEVLKHLSKGKIVCFCQYNSDKCQSRHNPLEKHLNNLSCEGAVLTYVTLLAPIIVIPADNN